MAAAYIKVYDKKGKCIRRHGGNRRHIRETLALWESLDRHELVKLGVPIKALPLSFSHHIK